MALSLAHSLNHNAVLYHVKCSTQDGKTWMYTVPHPSEQKRLFQDKKDRYNVGMLTRIWTKTSGDDKPKT